MPVNNKIMNTQGKITQIIESTYKNYKGNSLKKLESLHISLRKEKGDEWFLSHLLEQETNNPKPVFTIK